MVNHIPGKPTMVVQNMPGGGGVVAANFMYNIAPKDGSVIANIQRQVPFLQILGKRGPKFEAAKFNWIGSLNNEVTVCVALKSAKVKSLADLKNNELLIGGSGPNDTETVPAILNNTLGTKFKLISGYPSSTAITLAMERGEVEAVCSSYSSLRSRNADWFKKDFINIIIQTSTRKHPELPNVPLALDEAQDPATRALLELNDARLEIGRPFLAPPNVPAERVKALRDAFEKTTTDKTFLADVAKQRRDINPVNGDAVQALIERVAKTDKAILAKLDDVIIYKGTKGKAQIKLAEFTAPIAELQNGGRAIVLKNSAGKTFKAKVSGSRTKITVAGASAKRSAMQVGMVCTVKALANGEEAANIDCK
jgi:tripartite-type tricarboxylate transporter receptor subunit TctC